MDRKKLAWIHIVKKELSLSDEDYRKILQREAGVTSAKDLTDQSFRRLMRFLVRSRHYVLNRKGMTLRQKLYIDHLKRHLAWSDDHLQNFLRKYYKCETPMSLTRAAASKVIVALNHILQQNTASGPDRNR